MAQKLIHIYTVCCTTPFKVAQDSDPSLLGATMPAHLSARTETLKTIMSTKGLCGLFQVAGPL